MPADRAVVEAARADKATDREALLASEQHERGNGVLAGFTVGTIVVPDLDLDVIEMNELAPAKARSPYNRASYKLGAKQVLDKDTTTYAVLADVHRAMAAKVVVTVTPPVTPPVTPVVTPAIVADVDMGMVAALVSVLGITEADARIRVAAMSA